MWKEFREFAFKGNALDLAIGVIIGAAFGKIVTAMVNDIIMPFVSIILPSGEWRTTAITLVERAPAGPEGDARLLVGDLLSVTVDFVIVGFVLFLVVRTINRFKRAEPPPPPAPSEKQCPECLEKVALAAQRCKYCTSALPA